MTFVLDTLITLISLIFLSILGIIAGFAVPGLFLPAVAPWLDWILPVKSKDSGPDVR